MISSGIGKAIHNTLKELVITGLHIKTKLAQDKPALGRHGHVN